MKQYVVDDLRPSELNALESRFEASLIKAGTGDVFWLEIDKAALGPYQLAHRESCGPFYFSVVPEADRLVIDLLVRSLKHMRCDCMRFAEPAQFAWLDAWVDDVFAGLNIKL